MDDTSNDETRLSMAKAGKLTADNYLEMFRHLTGREPTPEQEKKLRDKMAKVEQEDRGAV